jgi:hypothetical protein
MEKGERMRSILIVLVEALVLCGLCSHLASAQVNAAVAPSAWEPMYWEQLMTAAKDAQQRGAKIEAEGLCAQAIPYVEVQAVKALRDHAELLEAQKSASASDVRAKAERLAQVKAEQARANGPGSMYLGFSPWEELFVYVGALQLLQRDSEAQAVRVLAIAYRRSQEAYVRRSILMREHKDPRGEC